MDKEPINCHDDDLGALLHQLFQDGASEVEIRHPTEGPRIITRAEFYGLVDELGKSKAMSPADRLMERQRLANQAKQMQVEWCTAMLAAKVEAVDFENGEFGYTAAGEQMDVAGMTFVAVADYLPEIAVLPDELGCFVCDQMSKPPIRVVMDGPGPDDVIH